MILNDELGQAARTIIEAVAMSVGARPHAAIGPVADDFNRLLEQSRVRHASSELVGQLRPLPATAPLVALLTRVSVLKGALDAAAHERDEPS